MLTDDISEWKYRLAKRQSSGDFDNLTPSLREGNSSCLLFVVTKWFSIASCSILSSTILSLFKDSIALHDLWCTLRPRSPLHFLPQIHLWQSLFTISLQSRWTALKLFETLSLPWLPPFLWYLSLSSHLQSWRFKTSNSFSQKLQITSIASIPIIVTLFIAIQIPDSFLQRINTKTSSTDDKH